MLTNIYINQSKVLEWGLNLPQSSLLSYLIEISKKEDYYNYNGFVWFVITKKRIASELPVITSKTDTVYRLIKQLEKKGIIVTDFFNNKNHIRITDKGNEWINEVSNKVFIPTYLIDAVSFEALGFYSYLLSQKSPFEFKYNEWVRPYVLEQLAVDLSQHGLVVINYNSNGRISQLFVQSLKYN